MVDPDVVLRAHGHDGDPIELRGTAWLAQGAMTARRLRTYVRPA